MQAEKVSRWGKSSRPHLLRVTLFEINSSTKCTSEELRKSSDRPGHGIQCWKRWKERVLSIFLPTTLRQQHRKFCEERSFHLVRGRNSAAQALSLSSMSFPVQWILPEGRVPALHEALYLLDGSLALRSWCYTANPNSGGRAIQTPTMGGAGCECERQLTVCFKAQHHCREIHHEVER